MERLSVTYNSSQDILQCVDYIIVHWYMVKYGLLNDLYVVCFFYLLSLILKNVQDGRDHLSLHL